ncbi:MAG: HD domain-containing protein [Lentisphaerales bacterium]|nr:HD domain-containing protein [Lentisphaerales bacterium]
MNKKSSTISAVIDIGSSAIRMLIAEETDDPQIKWRPLDSYEKKVELGRDVFHDHEISREGMLESLKILSEFKAVLKSWGIDASEVKVIGTSALREANNRDVFIDRVFLRTGLKVRVIEGVEANQLTFTAVQAVMKESWSKFSQANSVIVEVSGGSSEIMLLYRGSIVASHTFRMGTVRIEQQLKSLPGSADVVAGIIHDNVEATLDMYEHEYSFKKARFMVALGGELRTLAAKIGTKKKSIWEIDSATFMAFRGKVLNSTPQDIASEYLLSIIDAESLNALLTVYTRILERTTAKTILIPDASIRDGVLLSLGGKGKEFKRKFKSQVMASAMNLGRKYHFDETHSVYVAKLSEQLFDGLKKQHGLGDKYRLMLEVAALLHDVGAFINQSAHHKHSYYIVRNSELFGLGQDERVIISHVVRYHRKALPTSSHTEFNSLDWKTRMVIMKLAAILRFADALDSSHSQRVKVSNIEVREEKIEVNCQGLIDLSLEKISLKNKGDLFEEVYGMNISLVNGSVLF